MKIEFPFMEKFEFRLSFSKNSIIGGLLSFGINWLISFIRTKLKIEVREEDILKFYYELDRFISKTKLSELVSEIDEEKFTEFLLQFLDAVDIEVDKNPQIMRNRKFLWDLFITIKDYVNMDLIVKSGLKSEFAGAVNRKIIQNEEVLNYKIKRDIDEAILDYEKNEKKSPSVEIITDKGYDGSSLLGGEMRISNSAFENNDL